MDLINIVSNTFYIKGGTNTGVYINDNKESLIIDPGLGGLRPKKIIQMLEKNTIKLKFIINTHEHNDHYGSCSQFKEYYNDVIILSSEYAKLYIENPQLFSNYILGGKANEFIEGKLKNKSLEPVKIDKTIHEGLFDFNDINCRVINFKGHTPGSIGILTIDKVLFVGDLLVGEETLEKYDFLFTFDILEYIKSLDKLNEIDFNYLVLGHGKNIISKNDSYKLIDKHKECIKKYINQIKNLLNQQMGIDTLLKNIILENDLKYNYKEYHFYRSSLMSVISYLSELKEIDYLLCNGELLYYTKRK